MKARSHMLTRALIRCYPFKCGQGRVIDRSFLGKLRFEVDELVVKTRRGFEMTVMPNDHIGRHIFLTGAFDDAIVSTMLYFARPGDQVLDIGANIGYVSCSLLAALPGCRVVAVEPLPLCYGLLQRNCAAVGGSRAVTINAAVSNIEGEQVLQLVTGNTGASHLRCSGNDGIEGGVTVRSITVPHLLDEIGVKCVDLIKIDVEGHEGAVLTGLAATIAGCRPRAIVFEHSEDLNAATSSIRRLLTGLDYAIFGIIKSLLRIRYVPLNQLQATRRLAHDYVALPLPIR